VINVVREPTEHPPSGPERPCLFCQPSEDMNARTFYRSEGWFALLMAPPNLPGHTVLARSLGPSEPCPRDLVTRSLRGLDDAIASVTQVLRRHYSPKHVVFGSLRLIEPHFHLHLFPVAEAIEQEWRARMGEGYEAGRFFEFLGDHERLANQRDARQRVETGMSGTDQRLAWTERLRPDVEALRTAATTLPST
jgi:diadenosine tetraphosphate (Ap4A) HIT family hydrolase